MLFVTSLLLSSSALQKISKESSIIFQSRTLLKYLMNHSHVKLIDSPDVCQKLLMWYLSFNFFDIGMYLSTKAFCISAQVDIELYGSFDNYTVPSLVRDNWKTQIPQLSWKKSNFPSYSYKRTTHCKDGYVVPQIVNLNNTL